jgi:hypothetical protein
MEGNYENNRSSSKQYKTRSTSEQLAQGIEAVRAKILS